MKTPPLSLTQPHLTHYTVDTGHQATFAITQENYNPEIVGGMLQMEAVPVMGMLLRVDRTQPDLSFAVVTEDGLVLTENAIHAYGPTLFLETRVITPRDPDTMLLLADLEQCAAIALAGGLK